MRSSSLLGFLVVVVLGGGGSPGCRGGASTSTREHRCRCEALTDTDLSTEVRLEVCAEDRAAAEVLAVGRASVVGYVRARRCNCEEVGPACSSP